MASHFCPPLVEGGFAQVFVAAALDAGAAILPFWRKGSAARTKSDGSPVTDADLAANRVILAALAAAFPDIPVVSEESEKPEAAEHADRFFLVDPLDGTKEFLRGTEEFTVNIALIVGGEPVFGVVFAPAGGRIWLAADGAWSGALDIGGRDPAAIRWRKIACRPAAAEPVAVVSRSHLDPETTGWLEAHGVAHTTPSGSSIKFCLVAEGAADVYPRFGRTMEWDTAAGHAVLRAAGGGVTNFVGASLRYGKSAGGYANPGFIASGPAAF